MVASRKQVVFSEVLVGGVHGLQVAWVDHISCRTDGCHIGPHHSDLGTMPEAEQLQLEFPGFPYIVGIQQGHIVAGDFIEAVVARRANPGVVLVDVTHAAVRAIAFGNHPCRIVG